MIWSEHLVWVPLGQVVRQGKSNAKWGKSFFETFKTPGLRRPEGVLGVLFSSDLFFFAFLGGG